LAFENPVIPSGGRLNIYAEFLREQQWWQWASFDVEIDRGRITRAHYFNDTRQITYAWGTDERWNVARPNPPSAPNAPRVEFLGAAINRFGLESGPAVRFADTLQYRRPEEDGGSVAGTTLLGFVDVELDPGFEQAEVFVTIGEGGFHAVNGTERVVFLGFGDDPLPANQRHTRTPLPEAVVIPEPGTLLTLLTVVVCRWRFRA
jgi:hypothetical protein